jgi:hypothetical protein
MRNTSLRLVSAESRPGASPAGRKCIDQLRAAIVPWFEVNTAFNEHGNQGCESSAAPPHARQSRSIELAANR